MRPIGHIRVSPAMIVACLALLVALGGTSVAAVSQLVPRNSVGTPQVRNGAISTPKVRNNAITSIKVRDRSLRAIDFASGVLRVGPQGPAGPAGAQGPAGPPGTGAALAFKVVSGAAATATTSTSYTDLPGASTSIDVPAGSTATLLLHFTAESACYGAGASGYCRLHILVDGNEASPLEGGTDFAFDSSDNNTETASSWESHAVQRSQIDIATGSHTVTVQYAVTAATLNFRLDDWSLSVIALKQ